MIKNNKIKELSRSECLIKIMCFAVMLIYIYIVLNFTLFDRAVGVRRKMLTPLWEVRSMLETGNYSFWTMQIMGNILMMLPLGFMLPILFTKFKSIKYSAGAGFAFSLFIELSQYYSGRGLFEADDILHNTLGTVAGCIFYIIVSNLITYKEIKDKI